MDRTGHTYCLKRNLRTMLLERSELSTPLANFGFSLKERPRVLFIMRPSIHVSQNASERLKL
jgi:hypothetical protein